MNDSPRHNVGSIKDPHWVVDEEHYLKLVADADHFFVLSGQYLNRANEAEAQRDKVMAMLVTHAAHAHNCFATDYKECDCGLDALLKECGK